MEGPAPWAAPHWGRDITSHAHGQADTASPESKASAGQVKVGKRGVPREAGHRWDTGHRADRGVKGEAASRVRVNQATPLHTQSSLLPFPLAMMIHPGKLRPSWPVTECPPAQSTLLKLPTTRRSQCPAARGGWGQRPSGTGVSSAWCSAFPQPGGYHTPHHLPPCPPLPPSLTHPHAHDQTQPPPNGPQRGFTTSHLISDQ